MEFSASCYINAAAPRVWHILTNAEALVSGETGVTTLDGDIAPGARLRLQSSAAPGRTFRLRVETLEPPHRMVWTGGMPFGLFTGRRTFKLTPMEGGCDLSVTERFSGPLAGPIGRSLPDLTASLEIFVAGVARLSEQEDRI